ncbi:MAG: hypothetical protein ACLUKN_17735 [Bacilli bacterium]
MTEVKEDISVGLINRNEVLKLLKQATFGNISPVVKKAVGFPRRQLLRKISDCRNNRSVINHEGILTIL